MRLWPSIRQQCRPLFFQLAIHCFIAIILLTECSESQTSFAVLKGTIAIVSFKEQRIVIAVESASSNPYILPPPKPTTACKVISLGHYAVFYGSGLVKLTIGTNTVEPNRYARRAYQEMAKGTITDAVLRRWGELMTNGLERAFRDDPALIQVFLRGTRSIGVFGFIGEAGAPYLSEVRLTIAPSGHVGYEVVPLQPGGNVQIYSTPEYITMIYEVLAAVTPRAKAALSERIRREKGKKGWEIEPLDYGTAIDTVIKWNPNASDIAGPVDIAVLHAAGRVEWLARKHECWSEDGKNKHQE